jgi:hypothetical protein
LKGRWPPTCVALITNAEENMGRYLPRPKSKMATPKMIGIRRWGRSMDSSALASAEYWLSVIGIAKLVAAFLVAIGIVIEFGSDWVAGPFERTVNAAREAKLAEFSAEADSARQQIAKANAQIAEANSIAEREHLARVKLETRLTSRHLTPEQVNNLSTAVHNLQLRNKGIKIIRLNDPEAYAYAESIISAIHRSGLNIEIEAVGALSPPRYGLQVTPDLKPAFDNVGITIDAVIARPHGLTTASEIFVGLKGQRS